MSNEINQSFAENCIILEIKISVSINNLFQINRRIPMTATLFHELYVTKANIPLPATIKLNARRVIKFDASTKLQIQRVLCSRLIIHRIYASMYTV